MPVKRSSICTCALEAYRRGNLDYIKHAQMKSIKAKQRNESSA